MKKSLPAKAKTASSQPKRTARKTLVEVPTAPQKPTHFTRGEMRKAVQALMAQRA